MITRVLFIFVLLCMATGAQAQVAWSSAGTACVPNSETVNKYDSVNAGAVKHAGTEVGSLVFTCSMDRFNSGTTDWVLKLSYRDSTGAGTTASVIGRIYSMPIGAYLPVALKAVNSNASTVKLNNTIVSAGFTHTFDFETNVYFVQVTLTRAASTEIVQFYSVVLEGTPPS